MSKGKDDDRTDVATESRGAKWSSTVPGPSYVRSTQPKENRVSHPPHYTGGKIECIDAIDSATHSLTASEGYYIGNAIKYLWRWKLKNGVEDLKKARWYLDRIIEKLS